MMLYMLMMSERYDTTVEHGFLQYLKDAENMQLVENPRPEMIGLMMQRNRLAVSLQKHDPTGKASSFAACLLPLSLQKHDPTGKASSFAACLLPLSLPLTLALLAVQEAAGSCRRCSASPGSVAGASSATAACWPTPHWKAAVPKAAGWPRSSLRASAI